MFKYIGKVQHQDMLRSLLPFGYDMK